MVSSAKEEGEGGKEFGFLDAKFLEETCMPSSILPIEVKYEVYFILHIQPMKMEQIECSETSAYNNQTPRKYPKEYILDNEYYIH